MYVCVHTQIYPLIQLYEDLCVFMRKGGKHSYKNTEKT